MLNICKFTRMFFDTVNFLFENAINALRLCFVLIVKFIRLTRTKLLIDIRFKYVVKIDREIVHSISLKISSC